MIQSYQKSLGIEPLSPRRFIPHLLLPEPNRKAFLAEASQYVSPEGSDRNLALVNHARCLADYLALLMPFLKELNQPNGPAFWVISNLPIDLQLPAAPTDGKRPLAKETSVSELVLLAITVATFLESLSYQQERGDALVHEIAPHPAHVQAPYSLSSASLGLHTDKPFLKRPYQPEVLMMLALNNASQTPTLVAPLSYALPVLQQFSPASLDFLQSPCFRIPIPYSFKLSTGKMNVYSEPRPLITLGPYGQLEIAVNLSTVRPISRNARIALSILQSALEQVAQPIVLQPGMMLMFNNQRCMHGRTAIQGSRWLQRLYGRWSLDAIRRATGARSDQFVFDVRGLIFE